MGVGSTDDEGRKDGEDHIETGEGSPVDETVADEGIEAERLDLKDTDERLPWLESDDDGDDDAGGGANRAVGLVLGALVLLIALVGGIWWVSHSNTGSEQVAAGGVIEAPDAPYKEAPKDPGGKTFAGTGDSSFKVSEGQTAPARLGQATPAAKTAEPAPKASASAAAPTAPQVSGVGVQIAAYSNEAQAKAGWDRLSTRYEALKGVPHRVQQGRADIGTVYRLQAVAPDAAAAQALCGRLKSAGLACQVKN